MNVPLPFQSSKNIPIFLAGIVLFICGLFLFFRKKKKLI
jgi:LPXTG-motif cell wall-anchored protein